MTEIVKRICEIADQGICASDSRLRDDLGLDSLQLAVLAVKIEAEFGVDVFKDSIPVMVGDIVERIREHERSQRDADSNCPNEDRRSDLSSGETDG